MEKEYEYNGYKYWIKVEPAIHSITKETGYIAYVSDEKPGALLWGSSVKDHDDKVMFFTTQTSALINANAIKQSELDTKR